MIDLGDDSYVKTKINMIKLTLAFGILAAVLLSGCANDSVPTFDPTTLTIGIEFEHAGMDPAVIFDNSSRIIVAVYENLVTLEKETNKVIPQLAEDWTVSPDGLTYTFNLRKGVKFHDGTELTSEAVKLSLERMVTINKGPAWMFVNLWSSIETPDPYTVVVNLTKPDATFLAKLAAPAGPQIISAQAIKEHDGDDNGQSWFLENEAGTGPYMLDTWERGQQVVLKKFEDYWGGWEGKHVDKVVYKYVKESSSQLMLLEKGELDIAPGLPADTKRNLMENPKPGIKIVKGRTQNILSLAIHNQNGPLKDPRVRQAIAYAVDYEGLLNDVWGGQYEPLIGFLPSGDPNHYKGEWPYEYNLEKARALLKEAGYEDGFDLTLGLSESSEPFKAIAEVVQASLQTIGVNVDIQTYAWGTIYEHASKIDTAFDLMPIGNYPDYADSSAMLGNQFGSWAWGGNGWNFSYYANDRVDELLDKVVVIGDPEQRASMFQEIMDILTEEMPLIPIGTRVDHMVMRDYVHGYYARPMMSNSYPVYEIYKEEVK
jgi:peptide/nickel transport system substrate-binding protein